MKKQYPSAGPSITQNEIDLVTEAVTKGWYDDRNYHTEQFINEFKKIIKREYVLPCSNCTAAIHLALLALGIKKGDEVIVPDITWVASVAPIIYVGAKPVFVDISEDNWCISPSSIRNSITNKTKAIIVVGLYGNMPDMTSIIDIARENNLFIIEDAAESLGAKFKNEPSGSFGDISVFSFNATKIAVAGQGGVLATNNKEIYDIAKLYSHHGMDKYTDQTTFWSLKIGYNYQWTNIQAALALAQIRRLEELTNSRRKIFEWYKDGLSNVKGIRLNGEDKNIHNTYWVVTIIVDMSYKINKEQMLAYFRKNFIDCRPFFYPVSSMPAYKDYKIDNVEIINSNSYRLSNSGISMPSAANLKKNDIKYICKIFKQMLSELKKK